MNRFRTLLFIGISLVMISQVGQSQCQSWIGNPMEDAASDAHSIYRQALKNEEWKIAFENWKKAYEIAPTADGKRDYHFIDGAKLYVHKFKTATDEAKKTEYKNAIYRLYDEAIACYKNGAIKPSKCAGDTDCYNRRAGYVLGRKGFDMFYTLRAPYSKNLEVFKLAMETAENDTEYLVFDPIFTILVYQFEKEKITKEEVLAFYNQMEAIVDYNIENNSKYGAYYDQAWKSAKAKLVPIEPDIFDCDYFKPKYQKIYDENPDDYDNIKNVLGLLKKRGCPDSDPFVAELDAIWKEYAEEENARIQAEFEANNPGVMAKKMYDEGDYSGAIKKYNQAVKEETDPVKKSSYLFSKASIQFRKLKQYSTARSTAYEAAKLNPGWGRPYMLIGDMYGSAARSCGDSWNQRLAIIAAIDKYNYAKSIDAEMAKEAQGRVSKYYGSLPDLADGHMRGVKAGETVTVGCWIGEKVQVRFKS